MFTLIKGGTLNGPEKMGVKDILVVGKIISKISQRIDLPDDFSAQIVSATGKIITPGFIDLHVHILGGGGEGGPRTRTPEINLSHITRAGVTTVVGCLGTDDVTRKIETLLAKEEMLKLVTANPAKRIGAFSGKGSLAEGKDADLLILNPDLEIESVMAKGRLFIHQNQFLVKGTFEN